MNRRAAIVTATHDHPFWVESRGEWVFAENLQTGDELLTDDGDQVAVEDLDHRVVPFETVYNLTVADLHTYFVMAGEQSVLVHNCPDGPGNGNGGNGNGGGSGQGGSPTQLDLDHGGPGDTGVWHARPPGRPPLPGYTWDYETGWWVPPPGNPGLPLIGPNGEWG